MEIIYLADLPEHATELAGLFVEEWGHYRPEVTLEQRVAQVRNACRTAAMPCAFAAVEGSTFCGGAMLVEHDMDGRSDLSPWLSGVIVKPEYRRKGVGSALVRRVEREAAELGAGTLYLQTHDKEAYYAALGWRPAERCRYKGLDVVIMSKRPEAR
jgi:predicted N-acetyltransferase YhbS